MNDVSWRGDLGGGKVQKGLGVMKPPTGTMTCVCEDRQSNEEGRGDD